MVAAHAVGRMGPTPPIAMNFTLAQAVDDAMADEPAVRDYMEANPDWYMHAAYSFEQPNDGETIHGWSYVLFAPGGALDVFSYRYGYDRVGPAAG